MTTPTDAPVFEDSIKFENYPKETGSPLYAIGNISILGANVFGRYPEWSVYPHFIDSINRRVYKQEAAISGAVYTFASRLSSLAYELGGTESKHDTIRQLFTDADEGNGLKSLITKTVIDMCVNNNGAFWELVGGGAANMPLIGGVLGVNHLDSQLCYRTGIPEFSVVYRNPRTGKLHKLHRSRVVPFSIMPQPDDLGRNVGLAPVSRLMQHIELMRSITDYRMGKVSGNFTKAIGWLQGIPPAVLSRFVQNSGIAQAANTASDSVTYINNIPFLSSLREIKAGILNLASIPDGFQLRDEYDIYIYLLALCFGVDAREFWTATQEGATKADAAVQHMKARGKGFADILAWIEQAIVRYLIPEDVTFAFDFTDDEFDAQQAIKNNTVTQMYAAMVDRQIISKKTAENHLVHHKILIVELIEDDPVEEDEEPQEGTEEMPDDGLDPDVVLENDEDEEEMPEVAFEDKRFTGKKNINSYRSGMRAAARAGYYGQWDVATVMNSMDSTIRRGLVQAWAEGAKKGGLSVGDMTPEEISKVQAIIFEQQAFVDGLASWVVTAKAEGISITDVYARVDLWLAVYKRVVDIAYMLAAKDGKSKWLRTLTKDSCIDCVTYHGRVYRNSIWEKYGIHPQSRGLACTGLRCGCDKVPTDEPITRGKPPAMTGAA